MKAVERDERDIRATACLGCRLTQTDTLPLSTGELKALVIRLGYKSMHIGDVFTRAFNVDALPDVTAEMKWRITRLLTRREEWNARMRRYEAEGIKAVTYFDDDYAERIACALGDSCPPVFFCLGNVSLLNAPSVGYVGVRDCDEEDIIFTRDAVAKTTSHGFGVTSGGARGIDCAAEFAALSLGASVTEFTAYPVEQRAQFAEVRSAIDGGHMLIATAELPDEGFSTIRAINRNNYIYMQSSAAVAVRAHLRRGGTWTGVVRNLKKGWCTQYCRSNPQYLGNEELIAMGARPVDESWTGEIEQSDIFPADGIQLSMFDD